MIDTSPNLSPDEIDRFDALAKEWWDPRGKLRTLHVINPLRLKYIDDRAGLKNKRVLDVGCGGGLLCEAMAEKSARVTGIDASAAAVTVAAGHQARKNLHIDYICCTVEEFAAGQPQKFDVVTCMEMLEHVPDPASVIAGVANLLAPGGQAFFATINRSLKAYLTAVIGAEHLLRLLPAGTHHYSGFIRPSELCGWLRKSGFTVEDITGVKYLPLLNHAALHPDPSVNYMVQARLKD